MFPPSLNTTLIVVFGTLALGMAMIFVIYGFIIFVILPRQRRIFQAAVKAMEDVPPILTKHFSLHELRTFLQGKWSYGTRYSLLFVRNDQLCLVTDVDRVHCSSGGNLNVCLQFLITALYAPDVLLKRKDPTYRCVRVKGKVVI